MKQSLKTSITARPQLQLKQFSYAGQKQSLEILKMNHDALLALIRESAMHNPWITVEESVADYIAEERQEDLYTHMAAQFHSVEGIDEDILTWLIGKLDSNGWFHCPLEELKVYPAAAVLKQIEIGRHLDPVGCFAFTLKDCLEPQCEESQNPASETALLLLNHLEELSSGQWDRISQSEGITKEEIEEGLQFIRTLNPRPAASYSVTAAILRPDCEIQETEQGLTVTLPGDLSFSLAELPADTEEMQRLRQEAQGLLSCLQKRNYTLLQVMNYLIQTQKEWFGGGDLQHCTLSMAAKECSIHSSTVWRTIAGKGFLWKERVFPIQSLFSSGGVSGHSKEHILQKVKKLVENENKEEPYSDEALAFLLGQEGITISRRTVSKYRRILYIPDSYKRKR